MSQRVVYPPSWEEKKQAAAVADAKELVASRVHPLGAPLPPLNPLSFWLTGTCSTTCLGVSTNWSRAPERSGHELIDLYSWSLKDCLVVDGRTFCPGVSAFWLDSRPNRKGKRWSVKLVGVATEHVHRLFSLCPALMVKLYNGELAFALPAEVEL